MEKIFSDAVGYAVFPTVGKGAIGIGGARARAGVPRRQRDREIHAHPGLDRLPVRRAGLQRDRVLPDQAGAGQLQVGPPQAHAQASAIALTARASADLAYRNGVAIVTMAKGGLM